MRSVNGYYNLSQVQDGLDRPVGGNKVYNVAVPDTERTGKSPLLIHFGPSAAVVPTDDQVQRIYARRQTYQKTLRRED